MDRSKSTTRIASRLSLDFAPSRFRRRENGSPIYKSTQLKKKHVPDLIVFGGLIVELKSVSEVTPEHETPLFNYLRLSRQPAGYLINFAPTTEVQQKRFVLSKFTRWPRLAISTQATHGRRKGKGSIVSA